MTSGNDEPRELRQARLARNQAMYRSVNERVEAIAKGYETHGPINFVCECAKTDCAGQIPMGIQQYEHIRSTSKHFLVLPEHIFPEVERVVEKHRTYWVLEKIEVAGEVAVATDQRRVPA